MALDSSSLDIKSNPNLAQHVSRPRARSQSREKPVLAAMRRPQFQHEFTTESFNNTGIGSPSPARALVGNSSRTNGATRGGGLSAAFRRVNEQGQNNVNKDGTMVDSRRPDRPLYQPVFSRQRTRGSPPSISKGGPSRSVTRTPSPPQVRAQDLLLSPMSEVSEASPPREFAEAYKQINDAEDLAAQDEEVDTTDDKGTVLPEENARLLQFDPASLYENAKRRSAGTDDAIILESPQLQTTQDSIPSLPSDLELENNAAKVTVMSQSEKDLKRLNTTLGEAKAFSKARRRPKLGVNGLQRDDSLRSGSQSGSSNTSGSILSDGSLNIPSAWGRKARQGKTWLSRVNRDINGNENRPPLTRGPLHEDNKSQAIQDWQAEASMTPLPEALQNDLVEGSPSHAVESLPAMSVKDRVRKLEFGSIGSGFSEYPQAKTENPAPDTTRRREIQSLSDIVVEANFDRAREDERRAEKNRGRSVAFKPDYVMAPPVSSSDELLSMEKPSRAPFHSIDEKPNSRKATNDLADDVFSGISKVQPNEIEKPERLPLTAASMHLTSQNELVESSYGQDELLQNESNKVEPETKVNSEILIRTPAPAKSQAYLKTPLVTGAWIDTPIPVIKTEHVKVETAVDENKESVRQTLKKLDLEHLADSSQVIQDADTKQQTLQETAPRLPGSALAAIINRAKDKKAQGINSQNEDTLLLDDSTILSLEELLANAEESDSSVSDTAIKSAGSRAKKTAKHRAPPTRLPVEDSDSESDVGLTTRLDRLKTSIHDAKAGVGSLQRRINKLPNKSTSESSSRSQSRSRAQSECEEAGEFHDFIWPCEKCGHRAGASNWSANEGSLLEWHWRPLQIYMPQLWFWPTNASLPRLTKLGWCSVIFWVLVIIEVILCDIYSPPFYATKMKGYGVDINAPRPPFILPQLLWRHVLSNPLDMVQILLCAMIRFCADSLGVLPDIFANTNDRLTSASTNIKWSYRPGIVSNDQADALGMDGDEFL